MSNSEHIDVERAKGNIYWDCYQGYCLPGMEDNRKYTFSESEKEFYYENYHKFVEGQNQRNREARHTDRQKTIEGILENTKTCPEETILQLGNIDVTVDASGFAETAAEYFEEFQRRHGSHIHILDWALHLDEGTPHIHKDIATRFSPREGFEDLVFTSKTNNPINAANIKDSINYIVDRINRENPEQFFEHLTPYGLRHTFATNCIENGMEPKTLQKILGHNSLQMTMDLYCHVRESTLTDEMERIANFI